MCRPVNAGSLLSFVEIAGLGEIVRQELAYGFW
jgi:hypothetical protein